MKELRSNFAPIIREYLEMRKTLGYSNTHEEALVKLDAYVYDHHPNLATLNKETVRSWFTYETLRGYDMEKRVVPIRLFAQYIGKGAYVLPSNTIPRKSRPIPYILTDKELTCLFVAADDIKGHFNKTLKLMFPTLLRLLYTCGLRPPEVRLIKRDSIDFNTGEILIERSKGHNERIIVMTDDMLEQCKKYDALRAITNVRSEYFFARSDGTPFSRCQLIDMLTRCWQQANPTVPAHLLPRLRPYDLRHRFATAVLQKWINEDRDLYSMLPYLSAYMGHRQFSCTAYYIHILPENLMNSPGVDWSAIDSVNPEVGTWKR